MTIRRLAVKRIDNIDYVGKGNPEQRLDLYLPDAEIFPVFIYFHGGGIESGHKAGDFFFEDLQNQGIAVISAEYRMYPQAVYPEFIRDAASAVAWAKKHMGEYGNITGIFVGGSSAGGYITQMLCFDKRFLAVHQIDADEINGYVMDAGQPTVHFNVLRERGIDSKRVIIDEAAPIYHITAGREYAPMQVIVSERDIPNRYAQTQLMLGTLEDMGMDMSKVDYRYMVGCSHCQYINVRNEAGEYIFSKMIREFILKHV